MNNGKKYVLLSCVVFVVESLMIQKIDATKHLFGIMTSKKYGGAVQRNHFKRYVRIFIRRIIAQTPATVKPTTYIVLPRIGVKLSYSALDSDFIKLKRLLKHDDYHQRETSENISK